MHAVECDIYCLTTVISSVFLCTMQVSCQTSNRSITLTFWAHRSLQNSKRNPSAGELNTQWAEEIFAIFDLNRSLSQKRYDIGPCLASTLNWVEFSHPRSKGWPHHGPSSFSVDFCCSLLGVLFISPWSIQRMMLSNHMLSLVFPLSSW